MDNTSDFKPNLQQIPIRTPEGKRIRDAFMKENPELTSLAEVTRVAAALRGLLEGIANPWYDKPWDELTSEEQGAFDKAKEALHTLFEYTTKTDQGYLDWVDNDSQEAYDAFCKVEDALRSQIKVDHSQMGSLWQGRNEDLDRFAEILTEITGLDVEALHAHGGAPYTDQISEDSWNRALDRLASSCWTPEY